MGPVTQQQPSLKYFCGDRLDNLIFVVNQAVEGESGA